MATESLHRLALHRRQALALLAGTAGLGACAWLPAEAATARAQGASARLAAAWDVQGRYFIGLLSAATPMARPALKVHAALEVPSRAHGVCPLADGSVVAVARRPGD